MKKILIIEDEVALRKALRDKLHKEGYAVSEARDGETGLALAEQEHPDLIILDILMPKMGGLEMGKRLRASAWGAATPVLILSNLDDPHTLSVALELGLTTYLVKSDVPIERVVEKVREMIGA